MMYMYCNHPKPCLLSIIVITPSKTRHGLCVSEIALVLERRRNACVVAFETCYIYTLPKADLYSVTVNHPQLMERLESVVKARLSITEPTATHR